MTAQIIAPPQRQGDWLQTATGIQFWPLDPRPEEVNVVDIAIALSNQCRFGGHLGKWVSIKPGHDRFIPQLYSVAQHSVLVALNLPPAFQKQGLLHDAAEAYLVDVPRPIKKYLVNYGVFEARLAACIGDRFGVELCDLPSEVHEADNRALATEKRDLLPKRARWLPLPDPWIARITPWTAEESCKAFLGLVAKLGL